MRNGSNHTCLSEVHTDPLAAVADLLHLGLVLFDVPLLARVHLLLRGLRGLSHDLVQLLEDIY